MDIGNVMDDLGAALETISGLRVFPYWAERVTPPAASVGFPEPYNFDATYQRGSDTATFPVTLVVGKVDARTSRDELSQYANGSGASSVKAAIDNHTATAYDVATVSSASFEVVTIAGVEYLAAIFQIDVTGSGS
ncbi:hypothetical protein [Prauserella shujinwangii]|uniref:hypothetical protein n=1 Tax=Prauserella shujinwangii TaxID=1453103 RepID=UPI0011B23E4A|nr:hypothetical protein [Prauserella shujinwangii]